MTGPQSWEIRVVCLIWVQKCMDLAHSTRLELEVLRNRLCCYMMEELITLYYGNFAILGERVRDFTWHTGCSNCDADRTLRSQIFFDELKREHLGWTTDHRQEWGLFLLNCLLHNADSMKKKEH